MDMGMKIKKLRELRNYTQEYMANQLNMTTAGYGKIERNESEVTYQKLEKIAEVLGIKAEDISTFNENLVFNIMHNQTGNGYVVNNSILEKEKKLYEQIINQQQEEIKNLKNIIEKLLDK